MSVNTSPDEFKRFHELITKDAPIAYNPYYFPLDINGKDPLPNISWKNNRKTFKEAYNLMSRGYNIGIAATYKDPLVIVDIDDLTQVDGVKPTLKIRSRKRLGEHNFYFTTDNPDETRSAKTNIPTENAGEVRSRWQYVVASGSFVPCTEEEIQRIPEEDRANAGKYSILEENKVSDITFNELPSVYKNEVYRKEAAVAAKEAKIIESQAKNRNDKHEPSLKSAMWSLSISDVTGKHDDPNYKFSSPFHDSKTYKDTSISGGVLHCWRHLVCHSALTYIAVESGLSTCSRAGYPHGGGCSDVDFEDPCTIFTLWKYAKEHGYIPEDDPIPYKGIVHYALSKNICIKNQLIDGWKLPGHLYHVAVLIGAKEGINFGR